MSPAQPSNRDPLSIACELVGRFQHHFARIDQGMDEAITKVFNLDDGAAAILLANIDFMKKIDILRSVIALQFSVADKKAADRLLEKIKGINNPDRQTVIHSTFESHGTDSADASLPKANCPSKNRFGLKQILRGIALRWTDSQLNWPL